MYIVMYKGHTCVKTGQNNNPMYWNVTKCQRVKYIFDNIVQRKVYNQNSQNAHYIFYLVNISSLKNVNSITLILLEKKTILCNLQTIGGHYSLH